MKYISFVIIAFLLFSACGGTRRVVEKTPKEQVPKATQTEAGTPESEEAATPLEETPIAPETETIVTVNDSTTNEEEELISTEVIEKFDHGTWDDLLQKHVSDDGSVNYKGFNSNRKALTNYMASLSENMPNDAWSKLDKMAYWINAYNAMTVDLILRSYPVKSIKDIDDPWKRRLWKLGSKWYNLDEIEHRILRKMDEPRIHFGIVCASYSCPKLLNEAFTASKLDMQLTKATKDFLKDPERNELSQKKIKLSKIFKWFAKDFKAEGSLIDFLNKYSDIAISSNAAKSFKDYNWSLNE